MEYVVDIMEIRRNIHESCHRLITEKRIADALYNCIIMPLEDEISEELVQCKDCKYWDRTECIGGDCFCEKMFERNMGDGDFDFFTKENWYCAEGEKK